MRVVATRASTADKPSFVDYVGKPEELLKLAAGADVVVNCTPLLPATLDLFDARFFAAMKAGGYFINVGRGKSVVQDDLVAALKSGQLSGAGLDVTEPERPVVNGTALDLRRCGWELDKALVRGALAAAGWCCRLADNQPLATSELRRRYEDFIATYGVRGLDPFDTALITVPPWQLVVTVLERLERPVIRSF